MPGFYGLWPPNGFCRNHRCGIGRFLTFKPGKDICNKVFFFWEVSVIFERLPLM